MIVREFERVYAMEAAVMMTGLTVGGLLIVPAIIEFLKYNWAFIAIVIGVVLLMAALAPYSPEINAVWQPLSHFPQLFGEAVAAAENGAADLKAQYYHAFGG